MMNQLRRISFILIVGFVSITSTVTARNSDAGASAAEMLRLGIGGRAPAMGDAYIAAARGSESLRYNPAGLGWTDHRTAEFSYNKLVEEVGLASINYAAPIAKNGGWSVGLKWINYGSIKRTTVADPTGFTSGSFTSSDLAFSAGYGHKFNDNFSAGATGRYFSSKLAEFRASSFTFDLGAQWKVTDQLTLASVIQNVGSELEFVSVGEKLPTLFKMGAAYTTLNDRLLVTADIEKVRDEEATMRFGSEYQINDPLTVRLGWNGQNQTEDGFFRKLTAGFGVKRDQIGLDYAYQPYGDLGSNHTIAVNYDFGKAHHSSIVKRPTPPPPPTIAPKTPKAIEKVEPVAAPVVESQPVVLEKREPEPVVVSPKVTVERVTTQPKQTYSEPKLAKAIEPEVKESDEERRYRKAAERMILRATEYYSNGEMDQAIIFYRAAISLGGKNIKARYNLATIYYRQYKYEKAKRYYREVTELDFRDVQAHLYLGLCYFNLGEMESARMSFERVLQIDPTNVDAKARLAQI